MSDEDKFSEAFTRLPLYMLSYIIEGAFLIGSVLFILQWMGQIDWFLEKDTMDKIVGWFDTKPKEDL